MTDLQTALLLNTGLLAALLLAQPLIRAANLGLPYAMGSLDENKTEGRFAGRLKRAANNQIEALALLVPLVFLITDIDSTIAASFWSMLFTVVRFSYVLAAIGGIPYIRSGLWPTGIGALGFLASELVTKL